MKVGLFFIYIWSKDVTILNSLLSGPKGALPGRSDITTWYPAFVAAKISKTQKILDLVDIQYIFDVIELPLMLSVTNKILLVSFSFPIWRAMFS